MWNLLPQQTLGKSQGLAIEEGEPSVPMYEEIAIEGRRIQETPPICKASHIPSVALSQALDLQW